MAKKLNINTVVPKIIMDPVANDDNHFIRCKVLIVCEGAKTEPNYFKSFSMMNNSSGIVYDITDAGGGINTLQVVEKAIELRDQALSENKPFDSVWAVFDRDSFNPSDFDNAIFKAQANDIGCAWSNEAFELWYIYHFDDVTSEMSRKDYQNTITKRVISTGFKNGTSPYKYKKNDENMRRVLSLCGCDENKAIQRAKR